MKKILILFAILFITSFAYSGYADFIEPVEVTDKTYLDVLMVDVFGNWVNVPQDSLVAGGDEIKDADGDTFIKVEQTADCDSIIYKAGGTQVMSQTSIGTVFDQPLYCGNSYWGLNPGIVIADYFTISSAGSVGDANGLGSQGGGANFPFPYLQNDGSGDPQAVGYMNRGNTATTTDATVTTLDEFTMSDNTALFISIVVTGMESDGSDRNTYELKGLFYRDGGNATQQGGTTSAFTVESEGSCDCVFDVNGNNVRIRITGVAAETWKWTSSLTMQEQE